MPIITGIAIGAALTDVLKDLSVFNTKSITIQVDNVGLNPISGASFRGSKERLSMQYTAIDPGLISTPGITVLPTLAAGNGTVFKIKTEEIKDFDFRLSSALGTTVNVSYDLITVTEMEVPKNGTGEILTAGGGGGGAVEGTQVDGAAYIDKSIGVGGKDDAGNFRPIHVDASGEINIAKNPVVHNFMTNATVSTAGTDYNLGNTKNSGIVLVKVEDTNGAGVVDLYIKISFDGVEWFDVFTQTTPAVPPAGGENKYVYVFEVMPPHIRCGMIVSAGTVRVNANGYFYK